MRTLRGWLLRALGHFSRSRNDLDFAAELDSHLAMQVEENLRAGMTPDEARRQARLKLGGMAAAMERQRDQGGLLLLDEVGRDLRLALRSLRRNPGYTVAAVMTLALGIGANVATFSVVHAVLLRPLPFPDPDRLVQLFATSASGDTHEVVSHPDFTDWSRAGSFEQLGAFAGSSLTVSGAGAAELVSGLRVSASLFPTLGATAARGRLFTAEDEKPGALPVAILSDGFWKRQYGGTPDAIGRVVRVEDVAFTIVGVLPAGFRAPVGRPVQMYLPLQVDPDRGHGFLRVIGRLRRGVGLAGARAELGLITERLASTYPRTNASVGAHLVPLAEAMAQDVRPGLLLLAGVVLLVLLIACANVAGLMLARGSVRRRELAVRAALGAGRGRLVRQLLVESLVLSLGGGLAALVIGSWTAAGVAAMLAADLRAIPRLETTHTDAWVLAFTLVLSVVTGLVSGAAPAFAAASARGSEALREGQRSGTGSHAPRLRRGLVVAETALALVLLAGGGVLLKALLTLQATPPGFRAGKMLAADLWLPQPRLARLADRARYYEEALARLRALPGVRSAAFVADLPLNGGSDGLGFHITGRPDPAPDQPFQASFNLATAGYFHTMGIPTVAGREFGDRDRAGTPAVVVVNETAARRFWPGRSPLGERIELPLEIRQPEQHEHGSGATTTTLITLTVVGVTADVRQATLALPPRPELFLSAMQAELPWPWTVLVARTARDPETLSGAVRDALLAADPNVPVVRVSTVESILSRSTAEPRVWAVLVGAFAGLALLLAAVGLYGLIAFSVSQRAHEIGVRVALGAARTTIVGMVLKEGLGLSLLGTATGLAGATAATRLLARLAAGVEAHDPWTLSAVTALLLAVGLAASYPPARRAARVDPATTLRGD
ncbi:MAG TPA: ABC transporter permease [Vicinamibacteria bacterium]|nr:ABC transporter permease [Vicinamibacteria bacterium]